MNNSNILYTFKNIVENDIQNCKNYIYEKEGVLKKITDLIQNECKHDIITDYIDMLEGYKESVRIKYCKVCEKTFK